MRETPETAETAAWLYEPGRRLYPGTLTQRELMLACTSAAAELGIRRRRTPIERELLTENIRALLFEVADRERESGAPGSLIWDLRHCQLSLADAAANALALEYSRGRYRVLKAALRIVLGDDEQTLRTFRRTIEMPNGTRMSLSELSHESDAGHAEAIRYLSAMKAAQDGGG